MSNSNRDRMDNIIKDYRKRILEFDTWCDGFDASQEIEDEYRPIQYTLIFLLGLTIGIGITLLLGGLQ